MSRRNDSVGRQSEGIDGLFDAHVDEANLVLYLDHELRPEESARVRLHLEQCAGCRQRETELADAAQALSSFQRNFDGTLDAPPQNWAGFEARLAEASAEYSAPLEPRWKAVRNAWRNRGFGASLLPWGLATGAAGFLAGYLWLHSPAQPALSVNDVISRVEQSHVTTPSAARPVVYRKLRITDSSAPNVPVTVELWKRESDGRVKELEANQAATGSTGRSTKRSLGQETPRVRSAGSEPVPGPLAQLNEIYSVNHLDWSEPISADGFKMWADTGGPKDEQVLRENLPGGGLAYRLIAHVRPPLNSTDHRILTGLQILVRSSDWHAIEERLTVQATSGVRTYEVAELDYRELSLSEVPASIFDAKSDGTGLASDVPRASLGAQPLSGTALSLEVLESLDALDALVKDQVAVSRVGSEGLQVEGTVATDRRKAEIVAALGPLTSNPALKLELLSASEARDRESGNGNRPSPVQSVQVPLHGQTSDPRLRQWLADHGGVSGAQLDAEAGRFQMEAAAMSSDAQLEAQALSHILAVVPAPPVEVEAAGKWRRLVSRHAERAHRQIEALEQHLAPVFRSGSAPRGLEDANALGTDDLRADAGRLVDLLTASDHVLWEGLSGNLTNGESHRLTDPNFWLMLEEENFLAKHLMQKAHP